MLSIQHLKKAKHPTKTGFSRLLSKLATTKAESEKDKSKVKAFSSVLTNKARGAGNSS